MSIRQQAVAHNAMGGTGAVETVLGDGVLDDPIPQLAHTFLRIAVVSMTLLDQPLDRHSPSP
jgi:hypothetical protein